MAEVGSVKFLMKTYRIDSITFLRTIASTFEDCNWLSLMVKKYVRLPECPLSDLSSIVCSIQYSELKIDFNLEYLPRKFLI